jgi:DNA (cytosine-5)-methyltransferase 1
MIYLAMDVRPRALLIENTPTLLTHPKFNDTRTFVMEELQHLGYRLDWQVLNAKDFGVPQTRRSGFIIALRPSDFARFVWPSPNTDPTPTLGQALYESMAERGWAAVDEWARMARRVAPTIVGGSKKHGGADLGPTRTKRMWAELGVNAHSLADRAPDPDFPFLPEIGRDGLPKLTVPQVARLQGFPADWLLAGGKTARYKQVAQSVPPPLAAAVGRRIARALRGRPPLDDASRPGG